MTGFNSDAYGFAESLKALFSEKQTELSDLQALILGTGGASKAIQYVLEKMGIPFRYVSRSPQKDGFTYEAITPAILARHQLVINCTPLGTFPNQNTCPALPYQAVTSGHFFYDLVYNPAETLFLRQAKEKGASTMNGLPMLHLQAERSWAIWEGPGKESDQFVTHKSL